MASRRRGFSELGCFGALLCLGFAELLHQWIADSWNRGGYGPAAILGALLAAVAVAFAAAWWAREYGIPARNRRRNRQQKRDQAH
ncbi:hypothetical protein [Streptomyces broussonetiae]|uniref:Uncharacterized protein n=1 Tax=Streptomyces broussonetiae TaxID=2686304 RepID=A0ABV5E5Q9_9ACTN